jgi:hypothetical protein
MGMFSNAVYSASTLPNGVVHIIDHGVDEISVTNDAEDVLKAIHRDLDLTDKLVQYRDSEGQVDRMIHENGVFKHFASGPWPD